MGKKKGLWADKLMELRDFKRIFGVEHKRVEEWTDEELIAISKAFNSYFHHWDSKGWTTVIPWRGEEDVSFWDAGNGLYVIEEEDLDDEYPFMLNDLFEVNDEVLRRAGIDIELSGYDPSDFELIIERAIQKIQSKDKDRIEQRCNELAKSISELF